MDTQAILGLVGGVVGGCGGVFAIGMAVGRKSTSAVRKDLIALDARYHKLSNWKDGLPKELGETYVPRKELAIELRSIHESLTRIENALDARA